MSTSVAAKPTQIRGPNSAANPALWNLLIAVPQSAIAKMKAARVVTNETVTRTENIGEG